MTIGRDRQCVVLGGCGFLGSVVTRHLLALGWRVRVFDKEGVDAWRLHDILPAIELRTGDFMNQGDLAKAIDGIDTVIHFIGTTIPQSSMNDIQFDIESNVLPTVRLLELLAARKSGRLVYASSGGTVYGIAPRPQPLTEDDPTEPIAAYGITKLMSEKYIRLFAHHHGVPSAILRIANPFGESQQTARPQGAVGVFLHKALHDEEICIWGDGSVVRDYIYETDVATAVAAVLNTPDADGVYNVGTGVGTSLNELVTLIDRECGLPCRVSYDASRSFDVPYNVLDIGKLHRATGWHPRYTLADGLHRVLQAVGGLP